MMLPIGIVQQQSGGAVAYDPGQMTYNGTDGYYLLAPFTTSANALTVVMGFTTSGASGQDQSYDILFWVAGATDKQTPSVLMFHEDFATTAYRSKMQVQVQDSAGAVICKLASINKLNDGVPHVLFFSFNATSGTAIYYIDGISADDTSYAARVAPATGTLDTGVGAVGCSVGASPTSTKFYTGGIRYFGYRNAYLTNPTDFYHPTNGLQELDETGWTEWGAQPLLWNQYGTMSDNKGSAGNMTANGTITGPA